MTITRIGQLTAEDRVTTALSQPAAALPSISSLQARTGTYSYKLNANAVQFGLVVPSPTTAYRLGYWLWHTDPLAADVNGSLYRAATGVDVYESPNIWVQIDGVMGALNIVRPVSGTTNAFETLATVTLPSLLSTTNAWIHVGITHKIDAATGFLSVYLNGTSVITLTGDTRLYGQGDGTPAFATTASLIWAAGNAGTGVDVFNSSAYIDDWYLDSIVGEVNASVPSYRFDVCLPTLAGLSAGWTPLSSTNISNIDDNPNDGDTTYNKALAAGLDDLFVFSDVVVPTDHIVSAVIPTVFAKRLDAGTPSTLKVLAYDGVNTAASAELSLTMDYNIPVFARMTTAPDASSWSEADVNGAQFGVRSSGTF